MTTIEAQEESRINCHAVLKKKIFSYVMWLFFKSLIVAIKKNCLKSNTKEFYTERREFVVMVVIIFSM